FKGRLGAGAVVGKCNQTVIHWSGRHGAERIHGWQYSEIWDSPNLADENVKLVKPRIFSQKPSQSGQSIMAATRHNYASTDPTLGRKQPFFRMITLRNTDGWSEH